MLYNLYMTIDCYLYSDYPYEGAYTCDQPNYDVNKPRLKQLFWENYEYVQELEAQGKARPIVLDTLQQALLCRTEYLGYDAFECPNCGNEYVVYHHCHCKLCPSCGVKTQRKLAVQAEHMCLDVKHRHMIFTIPQEFRYLFRKDRSALNFLFVAARNTICKVVNEKLYRRMKRKQGKTGKISNPKDNIYLFRNYKDATQFGMIATLHTFGRDLKWNPHIHCLVPELIYDPVNDKYKMISFFSYESLRKTWQYELTRLLSQHFGKEFDHLKNMSYRSNRLGFYVYAKDNKNDRGNTADNGKAYKKNIKGCVNYMIRYAARPAMAESRLISYDKKTNIVKWWYEDHRTEQRIEVTESGRSLIEKLIVHIPEKHFRMIRYYGFYNPKNVDTLDHIHEMLGEDRHKDYSRKTRDRVKSASMNKLKFRTFLLDSFNRDILRCPCGDTLLYVSTYNPLEKKTNDRAYRQSCIDEMRSMSIRRTVTH